MHHSNRQLLHLADSSYPDKQEAVPLLHPDLPEAPHYFATSILVLPRYQDAARAAEPQQQSRAERATRRTERAEED